MRAAERQPRWKKSSRCESGACVEVRETDDGGVALRNSAAPHRVLVFSAEEWGRFLAALKGGEFDL